MRWNVLCGKHFEQERERGVIDAWCDWTPMSPEEWEDWARCGCQTCEGDTFEGASSPEEYNERFGACDFEGCGGREDLVEVYVFDDDELKSIMTGSGKMHTLDEVEERLVTGK